MFHIDVTCPTKRSSIPVCLALLVKFCFCLNSVWAGISRLFAIEMITLKRNDCVFIQDQYLK